MRRTFTTRLRSTVSGCLIAAAGAALASAVQAQTETAPAQTAQAQTAPTPGNPAQPGAQQNGVEEIVVTAERRNVSFQKSAITATVLSGEDLQAKSINTLDALQFTTPSLTVEDTGESVLLNIRGIGRSGVGSQEPSGVLIYRDGVSSAPGGFVADEPYYDLASVEVLRGPQGTLAGQNATGGALFIRENDPTLDGIHGSAQAQYGNYNDLLFRGALNIPITDTFAVRIATNTERRDSFYTITGPWTGNPGDHNETDDRVSFLWHPNSQLTVVLKNDYSYIDHGGSPAGPVTAGTSNLFNLTSDGHLTGVEQSERSVLQISYDFDNGMKLKSIGGFQYASTRYTLDLDGTDLDFPAGQGPQIEDVRGSDRTISEEINLISPDEGPFKWVAGTVYQNEVVDIPFGGLLQSLAPFGTQTQGETLDAGYKTPIESWGVFGQGSYEVNKLIELQLGARYSQANQSMTDNLTVLLNGSPLISHPIVDQKENDQRLTGKADINFHITDQDLVYAFVATGHKSGGINPFASINAPIGTEAPEFKPEEVTDYELGWKSSFFGNHLRTQLDAFYDSYKNFQVAVLDPSSSLTEIENVQGTSTIDGIEAQGQGVFGSLSFDFGAAYLNSEVGTFTAIDSRFPQLGFQDVTGRQQPNAPRWTVNAGVQYSIDITDSQTLTPRLDYGMTGARWATLFDVQSIDHLATQNVFNGQLIYDMADNWEITAYATNLFDLHYVSSLAVGNLAQAGPPRQFGLRVSKTF